MDAKSETKNITNWCATHITQQTVSFTLLPITLLQLLLRVTRLSIESHLDPLCIVLFYLIVLLLSVFILGS